MSARFLSGYTHALVEVPSRDEMRKSGVRISVSLCFGPGDENAITNITYREVEGRMAWFGPHALATVDGRQVLQPVFRGKLLDLVCDEAGKVVKKVKQAVRTTSWGARYRVFGTSTELATVEVVDVAH